MSFFDPTDIDFAECNEQTRAGNGSWTVPTRDLDGTSHSASPAGEGRSSLEWDNFPPPAENSFAPFDEGRFPAFDEDEPLGDLFPPPPAEDSFAPFDEGRFPAFDEDEPSDDPFPPPPAEDSFAPFDESRFPAFDEDEPSDDPFHPSPAGKENELSQGIQGTASPDDVRAIRACSSSLDSLKNNRHKPHRVVPECYRRPRGRGKFCGRCCVRGVNPKTGRMEYRRLNCRSWSCCYCGPRRARTARAAIRNKAESLNLKYFLTLTLDPKKIKHPKFAVPHLRLCFNKFREYLKRKYGVPPAYICVLEFTKAGVPHLHVLFDRYIEQRWISDVWDKLGGGRIVFIKQVTVQKVSRYLSKYLTKELLLSAPKGTRRITCARSIKLFPKFDSGIQWELLKSSIWQMLSECRGRDYQLQPNLYQFISIEFDEESFLKAFQLHNTWADKPKDENENAESKQSDAVRLYPESPFNQRRRMFR